MITEWKDLEGKTIKKVVESPFGGCVLTFEDGDYAHVTGSGEDRHGDHWPILSDDVGFAKDTLAECAARTARIEAEVKAKEVNDEWKQLLW